MRIVITVFLLSIFQLSIAQWQDISFPSQQDLGKVYFINEDTGFISVVNAFGNCGVYKTNNGGQNWQLSLARRNEISDILFHGDTGYAVGKDWGGGSLTGVLFTTLDRGNNWTRESFSWLINLHSIYFSDGIMYITDLEGQVLTKRNNTWITSSQVNDFTLGAIKSNDGNIYVNGQNAWYKLIDDILILQGGYSAGRISNGPIKKNGNYLYIPSFISPRFSPGILYSTNNGADWVVDKIDTNNEYGYIHPPIFTENFQAKMYCSGTLYKDDLTYGVIWKKQNGIWKLDYSVETSDWGIWDIYSIDQTIYAVGAGGRVLKYTEGSIYINNNQNQKIDYKLSQNYPNPFNPTTKICFSVPTNSIVKLSIFDLSGKKLQTLINEQKSPGNYEVEFN